jgi:hypothetical protein
MNKKLLILSSMLLSIVLGFGQSAIPSAYIFYSPDELKGFDLDASFHAMGASNARIHMNETERKGFMQRAQTAFVNAKSPLAQPVQMNQQAAPTGKGNQQQKKAAGGNVLPLTGGCNNFDFETGNFTGWTGDIGYNTASGIAGLTLEGHGIVGTLNAALNACSTHTLVNSGTDQYSNLPMVDPGGGTFAVRLGGDTVNTANACTYFGPVNFQSAGEFLKQTILVTAANAMLTYNYNVVLQMDAHVAGQSPYFEVEVYDATATKIPCFSVFLTNLNGAAPAGFLLSSTSNINGQVYYSGWQRNVLDLTPYIGQNITIEFATAGCVPGGHFGYAYIDGSCGPKQVTASAPVCLGGTMTLTAPSSSNATYAWSKIPSGAGITGSTTNSIVTVNQSGQYEVAITPPGGCAFHIDTMITFYPLPVITPTSANIVCAGSANGNATSTISSGMAPYTYAWTPAPGAGQGTATVTGLAAGNYTCTVQDARGCTSSHIYTITSPPALTTTVVSQTNMLCGGTSSGAATISASGGSPAYSYIWAPAPGGGQGTATATGLSAGSYTCTVKDANNCSSSKTYAITSAPALVLSPSSLPATCGGSDGSATMNCSGGTSPYVFSWHPGTSSLGLCSGLSAGTYTCHITDNNGCVATNTATVTNLTGPTLNTSSVNESCHGGSTGSASVTPTGGTGAYTYSWNSTPAQTSATATTLPAGNFSVLVTDANGCVASANINITEPSALTGGTNKTNASCNACNGSATCSGSGGTGPYTYLWSPSGQAGNTATALCVGSYTCTLTDAKGCTAMSIAGITAPVSPTIIGAVTGSTSGPINSGWAYLMQYDTLPKAQKLIDSVAISGGRYTFTGSIGGKFMVYAIANPATYPNAVKTYSKSADQWKNAVIINAACATVDTADIALIELTPMAGLGSLGGNVSQGAGFVPRLAFGTPVVILGEPIPGLDVNLEQHPNGIIIAGTTTDANGNYHFAHVPPGTFSVYVDIPGMGMVSEYTKTVTTNQMFPNLNYVADSTHIYPDSVTVITSVTKPALQANDLILAPNPFRDQLNVAYTLSETSDVVIELFTVLGEKVAAVTKTHQDPGVYSFHISAAEHNLSQGVYMFRISKEGKTSTRRIVRLN